MKFSIIIPCYNAEAFLRETIESVLNQTCQDFECIVVDDGSTDATGRILDEMVGTDNRLVAVHQSNGGVSSARNTGIEKSSGEWLLFLDSDDLLSAQTLQLLLDSINRHPLVDLFRFGYYESAEFKEFDFPARNEDSIDVSSRILFEDIFVFMWQFAYRRTMVGNLRFNVCYHRMEDRPFITSCLFSRVREFVDIGRVCLWYRQHANSAMHTSKPFRVVWGEVHCRLELLRQYDESGKTVDGFPSSNWILGYFSEGACVNDVLGLSGGDRDAAFREVLLAIECLLKRQDIPVVVRRKLAIVAWMRSLRWAFVILCLGRYLRYQFCLTQPVFRLYRRIRRHGEFCNGNQSRRTS